MEEIAKYAGTEVARWSPATLAADPVPSLFQKVLLSTDGTVTELVSLHAGRPIRARKVAQSILAGAAPALLDAAPHERILHRLILLGDASGASAIDAPGHEYLFAESFFLVDRFSAATRRDLLETELPIGLLWRRERLEMYREIVSRRSETCAPVAALLGMADDSVLYARTYLIFHQGRRLGMITEKFAAAMLR